LNRLIIAILVSSYVTPPAAAQSAQPGTVGPTRAAVEKRLDEQLGLMNRQAPIEIDSVTKLTAVTRAGPTLTYTYEVAIAESSWTAELRKWALQRAIKSNCIDNKETRMLLDAGYTLRHVFLDRAGLFVNNILMTKEKCLE